MSDTTPLDLVLYVKSHTSLFYPTLRLRDGTEIFHFLRAPNRTKAKVELADTLEIIRDVNNYTITDVAPEMYLQIQRHGAP